MTDTPRPPLVVETSAKAGEYLDRLETVSGMNKSTLVSRAVTLYGALWDMGVFDPEIGVELYTRSPGEALQRLTIT